MTRLWTLVGAVLVACSLGGEETQRKGSATPRFALLPVDEAVQATSLLKFRAEFAEGVKRRDVEAILSAVEVGADRLRGTNSLRDGLTWKGRDNDYWMRLEAVLALGGSFTTTRGRVVGRREFCAPYTYSKYPGPVPEELGGEVDPWVVIRAHVPVRSKPAPTAEIIDRLSYELVKMNGGEAPTIPPIRWHGVELLDERRGWVAAEAVRDPTDYHACFANIEGQWRLTAFERGVISR